MYVCAMNLRMSQPDRMKTSIVFVKMKVLSATIAVVPGRCAVCCRHHHWLLLLLPRGQELQDHGLLQEPGPTGATHVLLFILHLRFAAGKNDSTTLK